MPPARLECLPLEGRLAPALLTVTSLSDDPGDAGSLRAAVNAANAGAGADIVVFAPTVRGTITVGSLLELTDPAGVAINGPGADRLSVSGGGQSGVFAVAAGTSATLRSLAVVDGTGLVGIGSITGEPISLGGGLNNAGTVTLNNCTFTGNSADNGGGIYSVDGSSTTVIDCRFEANAALLTDADGFGGAIIALGALDVTGSTFTNNTAASGGAIAVAGGGDATVFESTFTANVAAPGTEGGAGFGGAIGNSSTLTVTRSSFVENRARTGGAISTAVVGDALNLTNVIACTFLSNRAEADADGAGGFGGAIRVGTADPDGEEQPGALNLTRSTLVGNSADFGGAVSLDFASQAAVDDSTITENTASFYDPDGPAFGGAGLDISSDSTLTLGGSIVFGNFNSGFGDFDEVAGTLDPASAFNVIGFEGAGFLPDDTNNIFTDDARLAAIADNGGPTLTVALLDDSPARDAGDPDRLESDQRDAAPSGVRDSGAFESDAGVPAEPATRARGRGFAAGTDAGGGEVAVFAPGGAVRDRLTPFGDATGVRVAAGDFNGDGFADTAVGTGPGRSTRVRVLDGVSGAELFAVDPFEAAFTGGVFVAAGDITGDGLADLVITPDQSGGPRVRVFDGATFGLFADFFGIDDPAFRGGARAAVSDLDGDGLGELLVAAGFGGGPRVAGYRGDALSEGRVENAFADFFAFEEGLRNGVFLAGGDVGSPGFGTLVLGAGPGGGPRVIVLDGADLIANAGAGGPRLADFFAGDPESRGGVRVASADLDGDGDLDLLTGPGEGGGSRLAGYRSQELAGTPEQFLDTEAFPGFGGGVFVG